MKTFVVIGASSGLGKEIAELLSYHSHRVVNWSLDQGVDVQYESSVRAAVSRLGGKEIDGLVNCAGVNFIDWFENITLDDWDRVMNTNARGMFLCSQKLLPNLRGKVICNIVSNASHVPMTNSAAYNASKGAAHILTLQMGRELRKSHGITVFGVSPNKLAGTGMSADIESRVCGLRGWSAEQAKQYQLAALPAGEETDPVACAEFIVWLLLRPDIHKFLNQTVLPFGG
jgi:NAD(P)-dependent dehydrogenase (short-subunit alcohol dehydrogenase family)